MKFTWLGGFRLCLLRKRRGISVSASVVAARVCSVSRRHGNGGARYLSLC